MCTHHFFHLTSKHLVYTRVLRTLLTLGAVKWETNLWSSLIWSLCNQTHQIILWLAPTFEKYLPWGLDELLSTVLRRASWGEAQKRENASSYMLCSVQGKGRVQATIAALNLRSVFVEQESVVFCRANVSISLNKQSWRKRHTRQLKSNRQHECTEKICFRARGAGFLQELCSPLQEEKQGFIELY